MKKINNNLLLLFLGFIFVGLVASTPYIITNCNFSVGSTIALTSSNTACQTPGGSTTWTKVGSCAGNWQANVAGYAEHTVPNTDCTDRVYAPVAPGGKKVTVEATFSDFGTLGGAEFFYLWCGDSTGKFYRFGSWDDISHNYELWKIDGAWTFLQSGGAFDEAESATLKMIITPTAVTGYEGGVQRATGATGTFEITRCGFGCGGGQYGTDDCPGTALRVDNFSVKVERGDTLFCNAGDTRFPGTAPFTPPTAPPTATPTPPVAAQTVDMVCATYGLPNRDVATAGDFTTADTIRNNCKLVLTWWRQTTAQNWCPYILNGSQTKATYCGPYNNFGNMDSGDPAAQPANLGRQQYWYGGYYNTCNSLSCGLVLRDDDTAIPIGNVYGNTLEKAMDKGSYGDSTKFIDKWFSDMMNLPDSPSQLAAWTSTAATNLWNMFMLDNYAAWPILDGLWTDVPIDPRRGGSYTEANMQTDVLNAMTYMRTLADTNGKKLYCNMDGDADYHYFERGTFYRSWVSKCHFVILEQLTRDFGGNQVSETYWLRRVNIIKDIGKNTDTIPVADGTNTGGMANLWYNLATILMGKESGKGMIYFQSNIPSASDLAKMQNLNCGVPLGDFYEVSSSYYRRNWTSCIILANPKTVATGSISLGGTYTNLETGASITSITLPAKSGAILYQ